MQRSVVLGSFSTARVVCERWSARAWFSSSSSFMKGALGEDRDIYRSTRVREENPKAKAGSHRRTDLKYMTLFFFFFFFFFLFKKLYFFQRAPGSLLNNLSKKKKRGGERGTITSLGPD